MEIKILDEVIEMLKGIQCGNKGTSCPDQVAEALEEYKENDILQLFLSFLLYCFLYQKSFPLNRLLVVCIYIAF